MACPNLWRKNGHISTALAESSRQCGVGKSETTAKLDVRWVARSNDENFFCMDQRSCICGHCFSPVAFGSSCKAMASQGILQMRKYLFIAAASTGHPSHLSSDPKVRKKKSKTALAALAWSVGRSVGRDIIFARGCVAKTDYCYRITSKC